MKHPILLFSFLAMLAGSTATAGFAAQGATTRRGDAPRTGVHGIGCQTDGFGAIHCADGTALPGGTFGVTAHAPKPVPAAPNRAAVAGPDPIAILHGNAAEDGNLYGNPLAQPRGADAYGCRTGPDGAVACD
jgi:hypothetical protein